MAQGSTEARERLLKAWRGEIVAGSAYPLIARRLSEREAEILRRMAEAESGHRRRLEQRMRKLDIPIADPGSANTVLPAGVAGAIGTALSMATGAFLAERSEAEVAAANLERDRHEIATNPKEEKEELSLFYQLKGIDEKTADELAERMAEHPDAMRQALASEAPGIRAGVAAIPSRQLWLPVSQPAWAQSSR